MAVHTNSSAHPLIPPLKEEDRLARLRLLRSRRVGISTFYRLLEEHGTAQSALEHLPKVARDAGVDNYAPHSEEHAIAEMRRSQKAGAQLIFRGTPAYPVAFNDLNDAPPFSGPWGMPNFCTVQPLDLSGRAMPHLWEPVCHGFWPPLWGKRGMCFVRGLRVASIRLHTPPRLVRERLLCWAVGSMLSTLLKTRN